MPLEAHIKLFVRVRPILSSETALQCIQFGKEQDLIDRVEKAKLIKLVKGYNSMNFKFD